MKKPKKIYYQKLEIRDCLVQKLKESVTAKDVGIQLLLECINEESSLQQTAILKKFGACLQLRNEAREDGGGDISFYLQTMGEIFIACDSKNPAKRALASMFDSLDKSHSETACQQLGLALHFKLEETGAVVKDDKDYTEEPVVARVTIDTVSSLMENFKLGENVIKQNGIDVLEFLACSLHYFIIYTRKSTALAAQSRRMLDCLVTTKTAIAALQNCRQAIQSMVLEEAQETSLKELERLMISLKTIYADSVFILNNDFIPDCQNASGMAICLIISTITSPCRLIPEMLVVLFPHSSINSSDDGQALMHEWLTFHHKGPNTYMHLCLCHGMLTMLHLENLVTKVSSTGQKDMTLLCDVLFPDLCQLCESLTDPSSCLAAFRVLTLWTDQARQIAELTCTPADIRESLLGPAFIPQTLLTYVWNYWDHPTEGIRHYTKAIFENVVKIHVVVSDGDPLKHKFLLPLTDKLIFTSWQTRGKYGPLCCLIPVLGARKILKRFPLLTSDVLDVMNERGIASHAMDLVEKMCHIHKEEITSSGDNLNEWFETWIKPVLKIIHGYNDRRIILTQYCLPKLLKCCPESLQFMVAQLQGGKDCSNNIKTLITCLKTARSLGLVKVNKKSSSQKGETYDHTWGGVVPVDWLRRALYHADEQCRLDAFGLLCDSPRTTEAVSETDIHLLESFLYNNMNCQSPYFRQQSMAHLKKVLLRIKECIRLLVKRLQNRRDEENKEENQSLSAYTRFLNELFHQYFWSLFPGASFARRTTGLHGLSLLSSIFDGSGKESKVPGFYFRDLIKADNIRVLLDCLYDTYDVNKLLAYELATSCPRDLLPFQDSQSLQYWLVLVERLVSSPRAVDSSTASVFLKLMIDACDLPLYKDYTDSFVKSNDCVTRPQAFGVLAYLLATLTSQGSVAKENLQQAASSAPLHGVVYCTRIVLAHVDLRSVAGDGHWKSLISSLLTELVHVTDLVSPVVTSSSPEGHVIDDGVTGDIIWDMTQDEGAVFAPSAQALLVCCWRTMKEVALLLGDLVLAAPIAVEESGLLTRDQVKRIGDFFTTVLLTSKHRGAFELAYTGFVKQCDMLWRCVDAELRSFPRLWLESLLSDISSAVPSEVLSGTRRSAGVPFFVQAIVTTEPFTAGKASFKRVMKELLDVSSQPVDKDKPQDSSLPQVHARNILRALYRDTRLGEDVFPFVADGLMTAISGFLSDSWAVRNSSTLLYSALMTRVFGVKKSKDEHSRRNCMTGREFFTRFPSLHAFLLEELRKATETIESYSSATLQPSLYPVLVLLSRLYPSSMDGVDSILNMAPFIPYVIRCGGSSVMKTRLMAARAIVPLVTIESIVPVLTQLLSSLPESSSHEQRQNPIHGCLLQVLHLIQHFLRDDDSMPANLKCQINDEVCVLLGKLFWIGSNYNTCCLTRAVYLEVFYILLVGGYSIPDENRFRETAMRLLFDSKEQSQLSNGVLVGVDALKCISAKIALYMKDRLRDQAGMDAMAMEEYRQCEMEGENPKPLVPKEEFDGPHHFFARTASDSPSDVVIDKGHDFFAIVRVLLRSKDSELRMVVLDYLSRYNLRDKGFKRRLQPLQEWRLVAKVLVEMAMETETHPECLGKVYEVLSLIPEAISFPVTFGSHTTATLSQCWLHLLQTATLEQRDGVRCGILGFLVILLPMMYDVCLSSEFKKNTSSEKMTSFIFVLQSLSGIEQSVDVRYKAAELLASRNAAHILLDPLNKLGTLPLSLWTIVVSLLHDDDSSVRECMANVISVFPEYTANTCPLIPPVAFKTIVPEVLGVFSPRDPRACLDWLMGFITGNSLPGQRDSNRTSPGDCTDDIDILDRLFEKGSLNTYQESVIIASVALDCFTEHASFVNISNLSLDDVKTSLGELINQFEELLDKCLTNNAEYFSKVFHFLSSISAYMLLACKLLCNRKGHNDNTGDISSGMSTLRIFDHDSTTVESFTREVDKLCSQFQSNDVLVQMTSHSVMVICMNSIKHSLACLIDTKGR